MSNQETDGVHPLQENVTPPKTIKTVCVYCGSSRGTDPAYRAAAEAFGRSLGEAGLNLVYGGGSFGLMGEVARATLSAGGHVTGIIPKFLKKHEKMLREADDVIVTNDMHERKMAMFEHSDAFVALPGGIGTLEELVEQLTWSQLGRHGKPIVILNTNGFWDPFLVLLKHMRELEFIRADLDVSYTVVSHPEDIVPALLAATRSPEQTKSKINIKESF